MTDVRSYVPGQTGSLSDVIERAPDLAPFTPAGPDGFKPLPSFGEMFRAARPAQLQAQPLYDDVKLRDGYAPLVDALGLPASENPAHFYDADPNTLAVTGSLGQPSQLATDAGQGESLPFGAQRLATRALQEQLIVDQLRARRAKEPNFAPGMPDTVEGLHTLFEKQQAEKRAAGAAVLARGTPFGRTVASLAAGGLEGAVHNPLTLPSLLIGGGTASSLVQAAARDALLNGVLTAATLPGQAQNMAVNDEHLTFGEAAGEIAGGAAFGALFGGAVHLAAAHVPPALFKVMPESVQQRWAARMKVGEDKNAPLLKDVIGDMDNRELAGFARSTIGERMTPDETAAADTLERAQELGETSPFEPGPVGDAAHNASLAAGLKAVIDGAPRDTSRGELLASASTIGLRSPKPVPVPEDAAFEGQWRAILGNEHGIGSHGEFLTSPAGAIGPAQVMPGTAPYAAKLAGLPWDPVKYRSDPTYNAALGRAYYAEQLRTFGDPVKAAAAYNAGPGSAERGTGLRGAMRKAAEHGEPENWEAYLPHETQRYVADFRRRSGAAGEAPLGGGAAADDLDAELGRQADQAEAEALNLSRDRAGPAADLAGDRADVADVPVLKRELFPDDESWSDAQAAFHQSLNAPEEPAGAPLSAETAGRDPEVPGAENAPGGFVGPVYHGTNRAFEQFELRPSMRQDSYAGKFEVQPQAFFFSENPETARMFAEDRALIDERLRGKDRGEPRVSAHQLRVAQPFDMVIETHEQLKYLRENGFPGVHMHDPDPTMVEELHMLTGSEPETWDDVQAMLDDPQVVEALRRDGYDAVRLREHDGSVSWAVFDPAQIRGAGERAADVAADVRIDDPALKAFDDGGSGRGELADSLSHDLRMAAADPERAQRGYLLDDSGKARTLADILDELDRDQAAVAALRACAAPGGGA